MGLTAADAAFAAVPIYIAVKYRFMWFDTAWPSIHDMTALLVVLMVSWATLVAPQTCGAAISWTPAVEFVVIGAASVPVVAGSTMRGLDGSTTVAAYVAATMVAHLGTSHACSIVALSTTAVAALVALYMAAARASRL